MAAALRAMVDHVDLFEASIALLARWLGRSPLDLRMALLGQTLRDFEQFWIGVRDAADCLPRVERIAREICRLKVVRQSLSVDAILAIGGMEEAIEGLNGLLAAQGVPPVLFVPSEQVDLAHLAPRITYFCERFVEWPIGLSVTPPVFEAYRSTASAGRPRTLLELGVIEIHADADGGQDAAESIAPPAEGSGVDRARSEAERYLFELLEGLPITAGLFRLNAPVGFDFGGRPVEVDLWSRQIGLGIEIDGYHHFQDPQAYRRDRRKDWELQRRGYRVIRVLAEDVVERLEAVRDLICDAVRQCKQEKEQREQRP